MVGSTWGEHEKDIKRLPVLDEESLLFTWKGHETYMKRA